LLGVEAVHACTQLPMLVPQFPVGFSEAFEPFGQAPPFCQGGGSQEDGCDGEQPQKGQQNSTLSNGLQQCQPPETIPAFSSATGMSPKPKTVLIVDDDDGMRATLTAILKREYRVLRVSSGEAALPILNREDVDLILL